MGHSNPPAEYFEEGLAFLDGARVETGKKALAQALKLLQAKKVPEAAALLVQAKESGVEEAQTHLDKIRAGAEADTAAGLKLLEAKNLAQARDHFQKVVRAYGEQVAVKAKDELAKLESSPAFVAERTAAERFLAIRSRFQTDGKAKTAAALKQLIEEYPGTEATEKAKGVLKNMGA
jgi:TolA-binding protein